MSSQAVTHPSADNQTLGLSPKELKRLHFLGYRDTDIGALGVVGCQHAILTNTARPGSKAAIKQNLKSLAGIPPPAGIDRFSDEAIEERNAALPESSGVQVTRSEFTNQCLKASTEHHILKDYSGRVTSGADPLNAVLIEMEDKYAVKKEVWDAQKGQMVTKAFPTRRFRWQHPNEPPRSGPAWDPVYKPNGELWTNGELFLCWMPYEVYEKGILKPQMEQSKRLTSALERNKSDKITRDTESPNMSEGQLSTGKSEAFYA